MVDILDAAHYIVYLSYNKKMMYSLTHLKLQKILYLAQGWSYVWDNAEAFSDEFKAWQYGPVNERVYEEFKRYGKNEIPEYEGLEELADSDVAETLEAVWLEYGKMTAYDLVELTHMQYPWKDAYDQDGIITNDSIREYFQSTF